MAHAGKQAPPAAEIVSDPQVMGGQPVVSGTRVPAATIVACLQAGETPSDIFNGYPSLPVDGIRAVIAWAEKTMGLVLPQVERLPRSKAAR